MTVLIHNTIIKNLLYLLSKPNLYGKESISHQIESLQSRIKDLENQLKQADIKTESAENNTKEITLKAIPSSGQIRIIEKEETKRKSEE